MKKILVSTVLLMTMSLLGFSQPKYLSRAGHIWFYSKTPMETIEAHNNQVASFLDISKGTLAFEVLNKSFKFERALMEEHFNENYMESDKLPKASFKGKVVGFDGKAGSYDVEGELTIHGVANKVKTKMVVTTDGAKVTISGNFLIKLSDYKLDVPALAKKTLAETAKISLKLALDNK